MTLVRYLNTQILQVSAALTLIVLTIVLTNRFIQNLGEAVAGRLSPDILLQLMILRLPDFLLVILPLGFFLGIMIAYGRMHAENEMIVLISSGVSPNRLLISALWSAGLITALVAMLSLVVGPWGMRASEALRVQQSELTELDLIMPGQFQQFSGGARVTYAEAVESGEFGRELRSVLVFSGAGADDREVEPTLIVAESAAAVPEGSGQRFMRLEDVKQYRGAPGSLQFRVGLFDQYNMLLPQPPEIAEVEEEQARTTVSLIGSQEPAHQAELQWRFSLILMIPIIALMGVPLSRIEPRRGRYQKLLPAALLFAAYYILLQMSRDAVADGLLSSRIGLWWVHAVFLALGVFLLTEEDLRAWRHRSLARLR